MASTINNPRFPHSCKIVRAASVSAMDDEDSGTVLYEGSCRSYSLGNTNDKADVVNSLRKMALPMPQSKWTEDTIPCEGDIVIVFKNGFNEQGIIIDREPNNLGTDILWRLNRN